MTNTLLPRATGLQYSLRSLSPRIPTLQLVDITVAYPGIPGPPLGYGQSYYTLRSIFFDRIPPPAVHMHIRLFDVRRDVPIGDLSASNPAASVQINDAGAKALEVDVPQAERKHFEEWLRDRWREKDELLNIYLTKGSFSPDRKQVEIPLKLRTVREYLDAYCCFGPALAYYIWSKV